MEKLNGPLADALARHREAFNQKFAAAERRSHTIDADSFLGHLASTVDPIVRVVAQIFAERAEGTAIALYDLSLELFAAGLLGPAAKTPWVLEAWRRLLPGMPALMAHEPLRLIACVSNAVVNIAATPGARPQSWIDGLLAVAPHCPDVHTLTDCGKVLAWRSGMVQYRAAALDAASRLPPKLAGLALGLPHEVSAEQLSHVVAWLEDDPWVKPECATSAAPTDRGIRLIVRAGAFRGFGGPFIRPPTVSCAQGELIATDGEGRWRLLADACGVLLLRDDGAAVSDERSRVSIDKVGKVSWNRASAIFSDLCKPTSQAYDGRTLAVTIATSHHVFLLAQAASDP